MDTFSVNLNIEEACTPVDAPVENTGSEAFVEHDNDLTSKVFANDDVHVDDEAKVDAKIDVAAKDVN